MLKTLKIENFTVFPEANLNFSKGLNVIVGENGTGKSHLLKLGYALLRSLNEEKNLAIDTYERVLAKKLVDVFMPDRLGRLPSRVQGTTLCTIDAKFTDNSQVFFNFSTRNSERVNVKKLEYSSVLIKSLFIPPKEILSIFPGFYYETKNKLLAFDATYPDLAEALLAPPLRGTRLTEIGKFLSPLEENILKGYLTLDKEKFYFHSNAYAGNIEAHLMAEGNRKLGLLSYLLKNGTLTKSSTLFWDEPEANLNPKLLRELASILVELSSIMQIVVATHSLFLLREIDVLQEEKKIAIAPRFFGLQFAKNGEGVTVSQGNSINDIGDITALDEEIAQSTRYLKAGMES